VDRGLDGKVVLVTGGSAGIGRAVATAYAAEGAQVAVTYREQRAKAEQVGFAVHADLERPETIDAAVAQVVERFGGIDVLVVNAVRWPRDRSARFEDQEPEEWRALLRANLEGAFATVRAVLPAMRRRDWGRIVFLSSGIAEEGIPIAWGYAAAKAGLHGFARTLAWDLGGDDILVNVVGTGFTATERNREHFSDDVRARVAALVPQRRMSDPEDVARLVLWLGSGANTSVTGEVVHEGTSAAKTPLVVMT
jgi:NAD(P)-dependent dehydrogenase (short-subunit alcohol dehydrogenase family)